MWHFVRQFGNKATLSRAATLAAAGSAIHSITSSSNQNSLLTPLWLSKPNVADPNMSERAAPDPIDSSKHSCSCLSRDSIANAAAKIGPAVVNFTVTKEVNELDARRKFTGVGTIINEDGTILTCAHRVKYFSTGNFVTDVHANVAIVKIKSETPLPYAKLGSSGKLRSGDWVVAVGSPMSLQNTVTAGIISCVDRKAIDLGFKGVHQKYLQTNCVMYEGNFGGPLVNIDGEIVGINTHIVTLAHGISFAIPVDSVTKVISHSSKNGRVVRPWLGLKMIDLNDMLIAYLQEVNASFPNVTTGVLIPMVSLTSPAHFAGFESGDVLVEFGGKPVTSANEVNDMISDKVGHTLKAVVKRANNVTKILSVIPGEAFLDM